MISFLKPGNNRELIIRNSKPWIAIFSICIPTIIFVTIQAVYNVIDKYLALEFAAPDVLNNPDYQQAILEWSTQFKEPPLQVAGEFINLATQYAGNVFNLIWSFSVLAGVGTAVVFSIEFGSRNTDGIKKVIGNGFIVSASSSLIMMIIGLFLIAPEFNSPILNLQSNIGGRSPEIVNVLNTLSFHYSLFIVVFAFACYLNYFFVSLLRNEGRMGFVLINSVICVLLNAFLSYVLIKLMHLELYGATLSTSITWVFSLISCLIIVIFSNTTKIKFSKNGFILNFKIIKQIILLGISGLVINLSAVIVSMLETKITGMIPGDANYSNANGALQTLFSAISPWMFLALAPAFGLFQGATALIGYAYGSNMYLRCKKLMVRIAILLFIWFTFDYIMFGAVGNYMIQVFDDYIPGHSILLFYNFITYPFTAIYYISISFTQSIGKGKLSIWTTLFRALLVPVPIIFIAYGVSVYLGSPEIFFILYGLTDLTSALIILIIAYFTLKHYRHHFFDIDVTKNASEFLTFKELDLIYKLKKLNKKFEHLKLKNKKINSIENKIILLKSDLNKEQLKKISFINRVKNI